MLIMWTYEFSIHELDAIMLKLGYPIPQMNGVGILDSVVIYYHFRISNVDFQFGLRSLANDQDVINQSKYIPHNKLVEDAAIGEGSTGKNVDNISDVVDEINGVQDAIIGFMDNESVEGCYKPSTKNNYNVKDDLNGV